MDGSKKPQFRIETKQGFSAIGTALLFNGVRVENVAHVSIESEFSYETGKETRLVIVLTEEVEVTQGEK